MDEFTTWTENGSILFNALEKFGLVGKVAWAQ
jgi:hypothetical protein